MRARLRGRCLLALGVILWFGCDNEETTAALEKLDERVSALETSLKEHEEAQTKAAEEAAAAKKATDEKTSELQSQVATLENERLALSLKVIGQGEALAALTAQVEALQAAKGRTPSVGSIGVPECDDYLAKYERCIDEKLPEAAREPSRKALETSKEAWKKAAATPAGREALAEACTVALEAVATVCGFEEE